MVTDESLLRVGFSSPPGHAVIEVSPVLETGPSYTVIILSALGSVAMYLAGLATHALSIRDRRSARETDERQAALGALQSMLEAQQQRIEALDAEVLTLRKQNAEMFQELLAFRRNCMGCFNVDA